MSKIEAVIFDMDGLMFDTERLYFESNQQVLKEMGIDYELDDYLSILGRSGAEFKSIMLDYLEDDEEFDSFLIQADQLFLEKIKTKVPVKPGLYELLDYLDSIGAKKAITSSSQRQIIEILIEQVQLEERFDQIIAGDQVNQPKPHPEAFLTTWKSLEVSKKNCWILEDSPPGLQAAYQAGIKSILVPDLIPTKSEERTYACQVCSDLLAVKTYFQSL